MNGVLLFGWSTAVIFEVLRMTLRASGDEGENAKEALVARVGAGGNRFAAGALLRVIVHIVSKQQRR